MGQYNASVGQFATTSAGCLPHHHVLSGPQEVTKRVYRGEKFQPGGNEVYPIQPQILGLANIDTALSLQIFVNLTSWFSSP